MEEMKKKFHSIKHFLQSSPSPSTSDPEVPADNQHRQQHQPGDDNDNDNDDVPNRVPNRVIAAHNVDWTEKVIGFCLSWAASLALQLLQIHGPPTITSQFLSHAIAIAVTLLFFSKYMYPKYPKLGQVLENVGVLFGVTAFFLAITIPFPLCIKLIYWTIFALSLLAIFLCNR